MLRKSQGKLQIDPTRDAELRELAKRIARRLVTNTSGNRASALVPAYPTGNTAHYRWKYGFGQTEKTISDTILAHLRRAEIASRRTNPMRGMKVMPTDMALPVRAVQSAGVLWLVVDANDRHVSSLLTQKEAEDFTGWVNNQAIEIAGMKLKRPVE